MWPGDHELYPLELRLNSVMNVYAKYKLSATFSSYKLGLEGQDGRTDGRTDRQTERSAYFGLFVGGLYSL